MTGNNALAWAKVGGVVLLAFVAYRVVKSTSAAVAAGGKAVDAATEQVKEIVTVDLNPMNRGNIVNQAFSKMMGYAPNESLGTNIYDWLHPTAGTKPTPSSLENQGDVVTRNPSTVNGAATPNGTTGPVKPGTNKPTSKTAAEIFDFGTFDPGRSPTVMGDNW